MSARDYESGMVFFFPEPAFFMTWKRRTTHAISINCELH